MPSFPSNTATTREYPPLAPLAPLLLPSPPPGHALRVFVCARARVCTCVCGGYQANRVKFVLATFVGMSVPPKLKAQATEENAKVLAALPNILVLPLPPLSFLIPNRVPHSLTPRS